MTIVSASRHNDLVTRITRVLGNGSGDFGYGQGQGYGSSPSSYEVSNNPLSNTNLVTAEAMNAIYADMIRARVHQLGTNPQEIAQLIANANVIAESESYIVTNDGITVVDADGNKKGIIDFEGLMQSIENDRFLMAPTQATVEFGIKSTRTTQWNSEIYHEFTVEFQNSNHRRHFFNSGGEIRISAAVDQALTDKGKDWSEFLRRFGVIAFNYENTKSLVTGASSAVGHRNLTNVYKTAFLSASQGVYKLVYSGNDYKVEVRSPDYVDENNIGKTIQFKVSFNDKASDGLIDDNVDGTITSTVELYRADSNNVRVAAPTLINDSELLSFSSFVLSSNKQTIKEGESFVVTLNTTNIPNGSLIPYTITGIQAADFGLASLTGNFVINNNTANITFSAIADNITEGNETFTLTLNNGNAISVIVEDQALPTSDNITCIAVIDEVSVDATTIRNNWIQFRSIYPNRPFYLLQPSGYTRDALKIPIEFTSNSLSFYSPVNRDNGNTALASDWYTICKIDLLPDGSNFALWIDNSGSMTTSQVRASLNLLNSKIAPRNITYTLLTNTGENWVTPFNRLF